MISAWVRLTVIFKSMSATCTVFNYTGHNTKTPVALIITILDSACYSNQLVQAIMLIFKACEPKIRYFIVKLNK